MTGFFASSKLRQEPPALLVPRCGACGLYKHCESPKMKPYGDGRKHVLVVGEAPGETEDELGRPFIGKAGQLLRQVLGDIDVNLDRDALTTNAIICHPAQNETPDEKKIEYCRPNLNATIKDNQPHVIVTLGRVALESVIAAHWKGDVGTMERWVGWTIPLKEYWVCPTFHPSFILRMNNPVYERRFKEHLKAAFALEGMPGNQDEFEGVEESKKRVEILFDERKIYEALREIDEHGGWAAFDYETNCLKPEYPKARIISCSVSNGARTIAYPWMGRAILATSMFLKSKRTKKIASNAKFEDRFTNHFLKHPVSNWAGCTMIGTHCLDNRQAICSLKFQCLVQMGIPSYNAHIEPYLEGFNGHYNRIHEIDLNELLLYNGLDSLFEARLGVLQRQQLGYEA